MGCAVASLGLCALTPGWPPVPGAPAGLGNGHQPGLPGPGVLVVGMAASLCDPFLAEGLRPALLQWQPEPAAAAKAIPSRVIRLGCRATGGRISKPSGLWTGRITARAAIPLASITSPADADSGNGASSTGHMRDECYRPQSSFLLRDAPKCLRASQLWVSSNAPHASPSTSLRSLSGEMGYGDIAKRGDPPFVVSAPQATALSLRGRRLSRSSRAIVRSRNSGLLQRQNTWNCSWYHHQDRQASGPWGHARKR